ncbi:ASCH domain-containing protein [Paenibacillus sp. S150]|uniref:ASCH domain-containing protein n=1 Tax=Paenibacillus sp. S150 TaxID=2749826 RepID=UPI001C59166D|nr:ASCH domain-containing protein [Paenibacillus sp. S150]MBW4084962.1 ASCH domain-containing protein [Paenibacillus sp. S150]
MKCLTIRQPWATLIALGEKQFETRSWKTAYRGELAIHAGMGIDKAVCKREPFRSALSRHGFTAGNLPLGAIIATSRLADCHKVSLDDAEEGWPGGDEFAFGDYSQGRFAWKLEGVTALAHPIPAKGRLSFWEHPVLEGEQ